MGKSLRVNEVDPLTDPRWRIFLERHPRSSIFHTVAWLEALKRTYGYSPVAFTTSTPGIDLRNGMVFCRVHSRLTGRRLVSVPFSDHCEPLVDDPKEFSTLVSSFQARLRKERLKYIECRTVADLNQPTHLFHSRYTYSFHQLDLTPRLDTLFEHFHRDSTQRKIRRAQREGLVYEEGVSRSLLAAFYRLHLMTRQRQGLPPQPRQWFENLIACFGSALKIRVASKDGRLIAAILTIRHKATLVYKYGASDAQFNNLGGTQLLFWKSIQEAKRDGLQVFDLGRSNMENSGLVTFKNRWGARESTLCYSRFTLSAESRANYRAGGPDWESKLAKKVLAYLPRPLWRFVGELLYKHIG